MYKVVLTQIQIQKQMSRSVEETYQKMTQREHILLRPDTYVGSIQHQKTSRWVLSDDGLYFEYKDISFVPALYKIFDEVLVNAADNYQRDKNMDVLRVDIDEKEGSVKIMNNGQGIPVVIHKEHKIYVPHLIFGELLTGSNYNDNEKRTVGGRNGFGAKLANIYSTKFMVECGDSKNRKLFKMTWSKNMTVRQQPDIKDYSGSDYTSVKFYPDFKIFKMDEFEQGISQVFTKRVYDIAGIFPKLKVYLNKKEIKLKSFQDYVSMFLDKPESDHKKPRISDKEVNNSRWEVILSVSDGEFRQVSFVNAISTSDGGFHVDYIQKQVVQQILQYMQKKYKDLPIKPHQIRSKLWIFINCMVDNPSFSSQTKQKLVTKAAQFGSTCEISEKMIKELFRTGIVDEIVNEAKARELSKMAKSTAGGKKSKLSGIPKLQDANEAGTRNSDKCTLILTEGDSAKGLAMAGIEVVGRDYYGVFPLKGKLLNVRQASNKVLMENEQIKNLIKIIGLQYNKDYGDTKSLRYGCVMIMSDQDIDGSHIKGLIINFVHFFWPSLFKMRGFLKQFITPLMKVSKGREVLPFYTVQDFRVWSERIPNIKLWKIKYYKGLGTSSDKEAMEYFEALNRHRLEFVYEGEEDSHAIDLVFNKKKADDRKTWLQTYDPENIVVYNQNHLKYRDFINKQFIHFSYADNSRSIGSVIDGLKPGQRKILFGCFKRGLKEQIKVAQLVGYVSEHSAYHHGEMSLTETIIGMAQNFVGSNNINLLMPNGQFGSRNQGGKEHASARYVFTCLSKVTRQIFPEPDDHCLKYVEDDGQVVEPQYYVPIIPMILVNGNQGIGTGWSTTIPNYNPRQICSILLNKLNGQDFPDDLLPWYKGYKGEIVMKTAKKGVETRGTIQVQQGSSTVHITQLPVGKWTRDYKEFIEKLMDDDDRPILQLREYHTKNTVHFELRLDEDYLHKNESNLYKCFKLSSSLSLNNLVAFNSHHIIKRYSNVKQILQEFYALRLEFYTKRKRYLISRLERDVDILDMKVKFITEVVEEKLVIRNVKRAQLCQILVKRGYKKFSNLIKVISTKVHKKEEPDGGSKSEEEEEQKQPNNIPRREFDYLLTMNLWSLTYEKVEELRKQLRQKLNELKILMQTPEHEMWRRDIKEFLAVLDEVEKKQLEDMSKGEGKGKANKAKKARKKIIKKDVSDSQTESKSKTKKSKNGQQSDTADKGQKKGRGRSKKSKDQQTSGRSSQTQDQDKKEKKKRSKIQKSEKSEEQKIPEEDINLPDSIKNSDLYKRIAKKNKEGPQKNTIDKLLERPKVDIFEEKSDDNEAFIVEERPRRKGANTKFDLDSDEQDSEVVIVKKKLNRKKYDDEDAWP